MSLALVPAAAHRADSEGAEQLRDVSVPDLSL